MSLLKKALLFREENLKLNEEKISPTLGLLKRALQYLEGEKVVKEDKNEALIANVLPFEINHEKQIEEKEDKYFYFDLIEKIADEISKIPLKNNPKEEFFKVLKLNFFLNKAFILLYSVQSEKFIFWEGSNIDDITKEKFQLDLQSYNIFKQLVEKKSLLLLKEKNREIFNSLLSNKDFEESDFIFLAPFVFSSYIVGILVVLSLNERKIINRELMELIKIVCRLNGSLIYHLYQQEKLELKSNDFKIMEGEQINALESEESYDPLNKFKNFINNLINQKIEKFSIIHFELKNDLSETNVNLLNFYSDIQYSIMNTVGTNGYIELLENLEIFIVLPDANLTYSKKIVNDVINNLKSLFLEITTEFTPDYNVKIAIYPDDSKDINELLSLI